MRTKAEVEGWAITLARFHKAQRLADLLRDEGVKAEDVPFMGEDAWRLAERAARVNEASYVTRMLVGELMGDREAQKELFQSQVFVRVPGDQLTDV